MKTKTVRIPVELYEAAEKAGAALHMPAAVAIRYYIQVGINGGKVKAAQEEKPEINIDQLLTDAHDAAGGGMAALNEFLRNAGTHGEQALKYDIKALRAVAEKADAGRDIKRLPSVLKALDSICLQGQEALKDYNEKLPKVLQEAVKPYWKDLWRDAGFSDYNMEQWGKRPTARRDPKLWQRDEAQTDDVYESKLEGEVRETVPEKRLCPKTLKYI